MDWTKFGLAYRTPHGLWNVRYHAGKYVPYFNNQRLHPLGYPSPEVAVEEISSGGCEWPGVLNPGDLGISDDITQWGKFTLA